MLLFHQVIYHLSSSLPLERQIELSHVLDSNGAESAKTLDEATHIITNSHRFEGWQDIGETVSVVTDKWVDRSMVFGKRQATQHYSPDPGMIFSGVVACATELPTSDLEILSAGITSLGGQWRTGLTKDVTHLFAMAPSSLKYTTAMHFKEHTHVKVLLPHWFDDAVKLGMGGLSVEPYEWPDPPLMRAHPGATVEGGGEGEGNGDAAKKLRKLDAGKRTLYKTALWTPGSDIPPLTSPGKDVWGGRKILLSPSLELRGGRREAVESGIRRASGTVVAFERNGGDGDVEEELELVGECDVLVTKWRSGRAYVKAVREEKTIGTISWLFHVESTGLLSRPMDQLLHYPVPKKPIEGFSGHEITVTNYTGESREYLKKLITAMGAQFTPSMSGRNTVLIAAYKSGTKTTKAYSWSIPIVNHTWLEDCFIKWRNLTVGLEKYIYFPQGVDFADLLGERGVGRGVEEVDLGDLEDEERLEAELEAKEDKADVRSLRGPVGTENSAKDAREVEDFVGGELFDGDADVLMDEDGDDHRLSADGSGMDVDEEEEERPTRSKSKAKATPKKPVSTAASRPVSKARQPRSPSPSERAVRVSAKGKTTPKRIYLETSSEEEELVVRPVRRLVRRAGTRYDSGFEGVGEDEDEEGTGTKDKEAKRSSRNSGEGNEMGLRRSPRKAEEISTSTQRGKEKGIVQAEVTEDDTEESEESELEAKIKSKIKSRMKSKMKPKGKGKGKGKEVEKTKPNANEVSRKGNGNGKTPVLDDSDADDEDPEPEFKKPEHKRPSTGGRDKLARAATVDATPSITSPAKSQTTTTPKRVLSVLMPSLMLTAKRSPPKSAINSTDASSSPVSARKPAAQNRTESLRAAADERGKGSGRPSAASGSGSRTKVRDGVSPASSVRGTPIGSVTSARTPSKRNAATKASRKLRVEVMPDVMNYQLEMRNQKARKSAGGGGDHGSTNGRKKRPSDVHSADEEGAERNKKRRKVATGVVSGSRKGKESEEDSDDHGDEAHGRSSKTAKNGRGAVNEEEELSDESPPPLMKKPGKKLEPKAKRNSGEGADSSSAHKVARKAGSSTKSIKLMTTQVTLSDDIVKALTKLGIKMTTRPSECTHLLAPHLVRTEKFLCALAVAPFILSEKWALDSATAKRILPEEDYLLRDKANERKYDFNLADAILRAKELGGKLFTKKTFYVTPKVPIDIKLLKNVVSAGGGQVTTQIPSVRILNANLDRHVISCPEDISIWRPIAQHHAIFTQELLLTSALRQEVQWENDAYKVSGSF